MPTNSHERIVSKTEADNQQQGIFSKLGKWALGTKPGRAVTATVAGTLITGGAVLAANDAGAFNNQTETVASQTEKPSTIPSESPTPSPSSTETASPSPSSTPEVTPSAEATPASIEAFEAMSVDQFASLPKSQQLQYAAWLSESAIPQFAEDYYSVSMNREDILPATSIDNTPQEVMTIMSYTKRFAFALDGDTREKYLIAILHDGRASGDYNNLESISARNQGTVPTIAKILAYDHVLVNSTATGTSGLMKDASGETYQVISLQNPDGTTGTNTLYFEQITNPDGSTYSTWIAQ